MFTFQKKASLIVTTFQHNQKDFWRIQTSQEAIGQHCLLSAFYFSTVKDKEAGSPYAQEANLFLKCLCKVTALIKVPSPKGKLH